MGSPCMYYGDEIGMTGGKDPGCRKCMEWNSTKQDLDLFNHVKKLIALRSSEKLLANEGTFQFLNHQLTKLVVYRKYTSNKNVVVLINPTNEAESYILPFNIENQEVIDVWNNTTLQMPESKEITIEPYGFSILSLNGQFN